MSILLWNRLTYLTFLLSGIYIIFFSPPGFLDQYFSPFLKTYKKSLLYLIPWIMLWPIYRLGIITAKAYRFEIILMLYILLLGVVNIVLSDNISFSYVSMRRFFLTGIAAMWTAMFVIRDQKRRNIFDIFCCSCLLIIILTEIINLLFKGTFDPYYNLSAILTSHTIPLGSILLLLALGPFNFIASGSTKKNIVGWFLVLSGLLLILILQKKSTYLAVLAIIIVLLLILFPRVRYILATTLVALIILILLKGGPFYKQLNPSIHSDFGILNRVELYSYALHIYKKHPYFGIGLRSLTHENYLSDYQVLNKQLVNFDLPGTNWISFSDTIKDLHTFDNMLLTSFVELGTFMSVTYLLLICYIILRYCRLTSSYREIRIQGLYRLLPLIGLAVHSMTYDSLMFPQVNWLFHVQLGILSGFSPANAPSFSTHQSPNKVLL